MAADTCRPRLHDGIVRVKTVVWEGPGFRLPSRPSISKTTEDQKSGAAARIFLPPEADRGLRHRAGTAALSGSSANRPGTRHRSDPCSPGTARLQSMHFFDQTSARTLPMHPESSVTQWIDRLKAG